MPRPPASWPFGLEIGIRVTCDMGYLSANFSLPRLLCSPLRPDERDRLTDVRRASSLNVPYSRAGGIITQRFCVGEINTLSTYTLTNARLHRCFGLHTLTQSIRDWLGKNIRRNRIQQSVRENVITETRRCAATTRDDSEMSLNHENRLNAANCAFVVLIRLD